MRLSKGEVNIDVISIILIIVVSVIGLFSFRYLDKKIDSLAEATDCYWQKVEIREGFERNPTQGDNLVLTNLVNVQ